MRDFSYIVSTFARLSKRAVFNIKKASLCISNIGIGLPHLTAWSEIGKENFFAQFNMKGIDEQFNEIYLTFYPGNINQKI